MNAEIKIGISLFSLAYPFATGKLDLEGCLKAVHEMGYQGVEIVGPQMIPDYPTPDDHFCGWLRDKLAKYDLEAYSYGSYVDQFRFSGRTLTESEIYELALMDLTTAAKLGFSCMKTQISMPIPVLERLSITAEKLNVWIGLELHAPNHCRDEQWEPMFHAFDRIGKDLVGVVPDTGIFACRPHRLFLQEAAQQGVSAARLEQMVQAHAAGCNLQQARAELEQLNEKESTILEQLYAEFTPASMDDLDIILPYSRYMHGKFFYINETLEDDSVPFKKVIKHMKNAGFHGAISAEYEGYFHDVSVDSIEQARRYSDLMRGQLA